MFWLYYILNTSGLKTSCGNVSESLNHPIKLTFTQTYMCLGSMFEAFQKNGRPWERSQQAKTHWCNVWQFNFLDMSGSGKPYGKVSLSMNHLIKLVPTQTYMFRAHVWGLLEKNGRPWERNQQAKTHVGKILEKIKQATGFHPGSLDHINIKGRSMLSKNNWEPPFYMCVPQKRVHTMEDRIVSKKDFQVQVVWLDSSILQLQPYHQLPHHQQSYLGSADYYRHETSPSARYCWLL